MHARRPMQATRVRSGACMLAAVVMLGCPQQTPTTPPQTSPPAQDTTPPKPQVVRCNEAPPAFVSLAWVPHDARAVTHLQLDDEALDQALQHVATATHDPSRQLPIRVAFSLGQWTWQVPLLRTTLERAGFAPSAVVHVMLPDGTSLWAWPPACDLDRVRANLEQSWGLTLRNTAYGAIAEAPRGDEGAAFAYDLVVWGASAMLLVPAGKAATATQLLAAPAGDPTAKGPADLVLGLSDAPVQVAVRIDDLLAPEANASSGSTITTHVVDASGWHSLE